MNPIHRCQIHNLKDAGFFIEIRHQVARPGEYLTIEGVAYPVQATTACGIYSGVAGALIADGRAHCSMKDSFCKAKGIDIAWARCLENLTLAIPDKEDRAKLLHVGASQLAVMASDDEWARAQSRLPKLSLR